MPTPPFRLPEGLRGGSDPIDRNPFPDGHTLHQVWADATRAAEQTALRLDADLLNSEVPSNDTDFNVLVVTRLGLLFDIWTGRFISVVVTDKLLADFDDWAFDYSNACMDTARQCLLGAPALHEASLGHLRRELVKKLSHWKAEARQYLARVTEASRSAVPSGLTLTQSVAATNAKLLGGEKFANRLRETMSARDHMTVNGLRDLTGVDAKTIKRLLAGELVRRATVEKLCHALGVRIDEMIGG